MNKKGKTQRGITLIALVITIIVMLILVAVTISMAVNGGLFDYAGKAVSETNNSLKAEGQLADGGIEVDGVWYNNIDEYLNKDKKEYISTTESYVGYYADVDDDGTVDGVIYADLAFSKEGTWSYGYSYEAVAVEELKDYYVNGTYDGDFNEEGAPKEVLTATGEGIDRFYVMALEDVTTEDYTTFKWYNDNDCYDPANSTDFGTGKTNTATMITKWNDSAYGPQDTNLDLWGKIQDQCSKGWFLPSLEEFVAFLDQYHPYWEVIEEATAEEDAVIEVSHGLSMDYWSSSLGTYGYLVDIEGGFDDTASRHRISCSLERDFLIE